MIHVTSNREKVTLQALNSLTSLRGPDHNTQALHVCHICRPVDPQSTTPSDRHIWHTTWSVSYDMECLGYPLSVRRRVMTSVSTRRRVRLPSPSLGKSGEVCQWTPKRVCGLPNTARRSSWSQSPSLLDPATPLKKKIRAKCL